jgi:N-acetylneuraminic acid mutarotase
MRKLCRLLLATAPMIHAQMPWKDLPDLPQALGGQFVGSDGRSLIVAGGSYWDKPPWDQGVKSWTDRITVLDPGSRSWREAGRLPEPAAYGAAVNVPGGMILFGGQTPGAFARSVLHLTLRRGRAEIRKLADLPEPCAMMSAVLAGRTVYLAGGQPGLNPARALSSFLAIALDDLVAGKPAWKALPVWNGPARFFAHLAACGSAVYLAGGTDLVADPPAAPARRFLSDAHRYTPEGGWTKLADLPRPAQAGLAACHDGRFFVFGGSDGTLPETLREKHPGFRRDVLEYDPPSGSWRETGRMPASLVTTGMTEWNGAYVIAGGEDRPGHRSVRVVAVEFDSRRSK